MVSGLDSTLFLPIRFRFTHFGLCCVRKVCAAEAHRKERAGVLSSENHLNTLLSKSEDGSTETELSLHGQSFDSCRTNLKLQIDNLAVQVS